MRPGLRPGFRKPRIFRIILRETPGKKRENHGCSTASARRRRTNSRRTAGEGLRFSLWVRYGAAGSLLAGGVLLLTGQRRAGLVASAAGAALAMVDEKELVKKWWDALPNYLNTAQRMLDQAQQTIDDLASKRDKIMSIIGKSA